MKKILFILLCFMVVGCGKVNDKDVLKEFEKKMDKLDSYQIKGVLEIYRGDDCYKYDVDVSHKKDDYYRVSLINQVNNHEQIILRNDEGVYVLTPSLNKSFKFQSDWPYNNSQIYLLNTILTDLQNDSDRAMEKTDNGYMLESKVYYSTNQDLVKQKVYFDQDINVTKVEILNDSDQVEMSMTISDYQSDVEFDDNYFSLEGNIKDYELEETMDTLDEIVYPMYVPTNTYLTNQDKIETVSGERAILTFDGDNSFMLVEETVTVDQQLDSNIIYGDPHLILDTVGAVNDYSLSWISNGVEYYLVSDTMDIVEMISVAESISVMPVGK